jgi:hypothetical protein
MSGREEAISEDGYLGDEEDGIVSRSVRYLFHQVVGVFGFRTKGAGEGLGANCAGLCSVGEAFKGQHQGMQPRLQGIGMLLSLPGFTWAAISLLPD